MCCGSSPGAKYHHKPVVLSSLGPLCICCFNTKMFRGSHPMDGSHLIGHWKISVMCVRRLPKRINAGICIALTTETFEFETKRHGSMFCRAAEDPSNNWAVFTLNPYHCPRSHSIPYLPYLMLPHLHNTLFPSLLDFALPTSRGVKL